LGEIGQLEFTVKANADYLIILIYNYVAVETNWDDNNHEQFN